MTSSFGQVKDGDPCRSWQERNVDVRFLDYGKIEKIGGDKLKQVVEIKKGVTGDLAKKIVRDGQGQQAQSPGEHSGRRGAHQQHEARRLWQSAIALLKKDVTDTPLCDFNEFPGLSVAFYKPPENRVIGTPALTARSDIEILNN